MRRTSKGYKLKHAYDLYHKLWKIKLFSRRRRKTSKSDIAVDFSKFQEPNDKSQ